MCHNSTTRGDSTEELDLQRGSDARVGPCLTLLHQSRVELDDLRHGLIHQGHGYTTVQNSSDTRDFLAQSVEGRNLLDWRFRIMNAFTIRHAEIAEHVIQSARGTEEIGEELVLKIGDWVATLWKIDVCIR